MHKVRYVSRKAHHAVLRNSGFLAQSEFPLVPSVMWLEKRRLSL